MSHTCRTLGLVLAVSMITSPPAAAQSAEPDLGGLSLQELMSLEITSASRKEQRLASVPGAVYVLTADDIRRSGMSSLAEVFRLVPGMQVAQVNANKWAVSIRGFNGVYANKLLVLVDGRPVYNRLYAGVIWDVEDVVLDDIERIEIVRGPGGPMWGTNAVNGVINIVTRAATASAETTLRLSSATFDGDSASLVHGGSHAGTNYRFVTQWTGLRSSRLDGESAADEGASWRLGGRLQRIGDRGEVSVDAHVRSGWNDPLWLVPIAPPAPPQVVRGRNDFTSGTVTARASRTLALGTALQVQGSGETLSLDARGGNYTHHAGDLDVQLRRPVGRHDVVFGAAYRLIDESFTNLLHVSLSPAHSRESIVSAFVQDDVRITSTLTGTVGLRLEKDSGFSWQVQPTIRALWTPAPRHRLWGALSRAVRMPSLQERGISVEFQAADIGIGLPVGTSVSGNPDLRAEAVVATEAGYRLLAGRIELDLTAFHARYTHLRSSEQGDPEVRVGPAGAYLSVPVRFANLFGARTRGLEGSLRARLGNGWRGEVGATLFSFTGNPAAQSRDITLATMDGAAPEVQAFVRSGWQRGPSEVDLFVSRVGPVRSSDVPAYTRLDLRYEHRITARVAAIVKAQNLLQAEHIEARPDDVLLMPTAVPRSVGIALRWRVR